MTDSATATATNSRDMETSTHLSSFPPHKHPLTHIPIV